MININVNVFVAMIFMKRVEESGIKRAFDEL